jgi:hypothetical protein
VNLIEERDIEGKTLREIAAQSPIGWLSPAVWVRVLFPVGLKKLPIPKAVKSKAPILKKVSKWPQPQERAKEMLKDKLS